MSPKRTIRLKRAYDAPEPRDGRRILVERLWPRGVTKEAAHLDAWVKDVAPSPELRRWYAHDPEKWPKFQARYRAELESNPAGVEELRRAMGTGPVTFVFAAKDPERNSATLLREYLLEGGDAE